ncbi:hypothetical protein Rumeso_04147 [Rubellimicrobium mesophilum DSM 19309]|uniref:Uncharacterized protein n=1 Tax=Rubellimicrobium mesophilum DSM 19309 TaxID=442562 RepID=A0A017HJE0_9RHOB|nr:hypothetical protein [Rubellimicrobium mesophilum]EYD74283.1 hypothetical protein Rumeso_04147 [Rubellimicrobium mesophilum DSM 19309]
MTSTKNRMPLRRERHLWDGLIPAVAVALPMLLGLLLDGRIF